jgi:hypothetical protein
VKDSVRFSVFSFQFSGFYFRVSVQLNTENYEVHCTKTAGAVILRPRVSPKDQRTPTLPSFSPMDWGMNVCRLSTALCCGFCFAALALLGCGQGDPLTPVRGQVIVHGKPLPGGTIVFTPDVERGGHGPLACGEIDGDGRYTLRTGDKLGAAPGWYRVTIAAPARAVAPGQAVAPPAVEVPRKYSDPEHSGLLREVQQGKSGEQDFHLE